MTLVVREGHVAEDDLPLKPAGVNRVRPVRRDARENPTASALIVLQALKEPADIIGKTTKPASTHSEKHALLRSITMKSKKMSASQKLHRRSKSAARLPASAAAAMKSGAKRRIKSAAAAVSEWSTAKKLGVAAAAVAVPVLAAAIATAIVKGRRKAALAKGARKPAKSRRA